MALPCTSSSNLRNPTFRRLSNPGGYSSNAERAFRRAEDGDGAVRETPREALARKLRAIAPLGFEDIEAEGEEFALVMIRRIDGEVVMLGEVSDTALVEKAAKKLVA